MSILSRKVRSCAIAAAVCVVFTSCVIDIPLAPTDRSVSLSSINVIEFVERTNIAREAAGLPRLQWNEALSRAAVLHARQMAANRVMAHEIPQAQLPTLSSRARSVGYQFAWLAENIAFGYPTVERVVTVWMNSAPHRENILSPEITDIGVGVALTAGGTPYYANVYGRLPVIGQGENTEVEEIRDLLERGE